MIRGALVALILSLLGAAANANSHDQLSPLPETGLWRHKINILIDEKDGLPTVREAQQRLLEELPAGQQAALTTAMDTTDPGVSMECLSRQQAADILRLDTLQQMIQRDVPDCELSLTQAGRSRVQINGRCNSPTGFYGDMRGELEIISSYEILSSFTGQRLAEAPPPANNQASAERLTDFELSVTSRWAAADCGVVTPRELLSF